MGKSDEFYEKTGLTFRQEKSGPDLVLESGFFKSFLADQIRFYDTLDERYIYRRWGYLYKSRIWGSLSSGADGAFLGVNQEPHSLPAIRGKRTVFHTECG
jgi:hypothetical protein